MRALPAWFDDAKLGIFIHWYPASVPAFAPLSDDPFTLAERHDWSYSIRHTPYAEWYWNSLALGDTPVAEHHARVWNNRPYADFIPMWQEAVREWDPEPWARLFARAGAKYVIGGTKHHDGVVLWPSRTPNPHRANWTAGRDLIGPLVDSVRSHDMRCGLYYSGGLDWTFAGPGAPDDPKGMDGFAGMIECIPRSEAYAQYVHAHWNELIERFAPDVLWNDIAHPPAGDYRALFDDYYARIPEGVVNDRFDIIGVRRGTAHADFVTPEYRTASDTKGHKFEVCRGIGRSFGYNALEQDTDFLASEVLVWEFVDIVARGGNLLLNVGPTARGEIPFAQRLRLEALGTWLDVHGEAIYATRPLPTGSGGSTADGADVRFTTKPATGEVFAIVRGGTTHADVIITGMVPSTGATVRLLGQRPDAPTLAWNVVESGVDGQPAFRVTLPCPQPDGPAFTLGMRQ
jgi:alpha-L-fucosidase